MPTWALQHQQGNKCIRIMMRVCVCQVYGQNVSTQIAVKKYARQKRSKMIPLHGCVSEEIALHYFCNGTDLRQLESQSYEP
jgi:hypothetical protein